MKYIINLHIFYFIANDILHKKVRGDFLNEKISSNLEKNIEIVEEAFKDCGDIIKRRFVVGNNPFIKMYMIYIDNIVNGTAIQDAIMTNLMNRTDIQGLKETNALRQLQEQVISIGEMNEVTTYQEIYDAVLLGDTILLMDNNNFGLQASTKGFPTRGVNKAETEVVVQGPKDSFTDLASTNIVLIRRRIRDTKLKVKRKKIGQRSKTDIAIMYMEDLVRPEVLDEIVKRLDDIDIDAIFDSGYIEQLVEKKWYSPFPQLQMTERPDKASSAIFEGRIVIVVDNTPFVVMLPATFNLFFQAAEDYYDRWEIMSFIRLIRYGAAFLAIALPGIYIALTVYHPSMIPTTLALKIAGSRQNIPFPAVVEVLIMEIAFELLREAGIRLPSPVSSTIGIVGGIIIGQAAVEAGVVSPIVVIVSALTGICTFVIPSISLVSGLRLTKYLIIFLSAFLGLYGFWLALILVVIHLSNLKSFGIPYLFPFCSGSVDHYTDWKDSIFRAPLFMMKKRPIFSNSKNRIRMSQKKGGKS